MPRRTRTWNRREKQVSIAYDLVVLYLMLRTSGYRPSAHERLVPREVTFDVMHDVLSRIRLNGAMFLRAEYTAPWACESPSASELIDLLQCQARRLVLFHVIAEGSCWIRLSRGDYVETRQGDVVVLPYADQHAMGVAEPVSAVPISSLLPAPPWHELPVFRHGGGGNRTSVVCGYLHCEAPMFEPLVKALPPVFIVRPPSGPAAEWVNASIRYALAASGGASPSANMALRLPALHDPIVEQALTELHGEPARPWTLDELARRAACSRSTLNERFSRLVG